MQYMLTRERYAVYYSKVDVSIKEMKVRSSFGGEMNHRNNCNTNGNQKDVQISGRYGDAFASMFSVSLN